MKKGNVVTKNHSRGVAFVEFTEHQHALVALRVLNNNPGNNIFLINHYHVFSYDDIMIGGKSIATEIVLSFLVRLSVIMRLIHCCKRLNVLLYFSALILILF